MSLWPMPQNACIGLPGSRRPLSGPAGCNQPFKGRYWCPRKRWFRAEPCPFLNRRECDNYRRLCGSA